MNLLVILASTTSPESLNLDWRYISGCIQNFCGPVVPVAYRTARDDESQPYILGIFCAVRSDVTLDGHTQVAEVLGLSLGRNLDFRIYEPIPSEAQILVPTSPEKHYMVLNGMTPNENADETFNDWYAEEHIPMLSVVPGWRSSRRFRLVTASTSPPHYLALHEWTSREAFSTPEFKAATNTPWRTRVVVEQVSKKERHLLEYLGSIEEMASRSG
ncbi:hypothetical protein C8R43DRAFT_1014449 [Mycena crocata]|nr:hypothetical protein C8R43DRAFT_1014449 [Mycena crocata]